MPSDRSTARCVAALQFVHYLWTCRDDGRWMGLECLFDAWRREADPAEYRAIGQYLADLAVQRHSAAVVNLDDYRRRSPHMRHLVPLIAAVAGALSGCAI